MSRNFYELQYRVVDPDALGGARWYTAHNGNGMPYRYDDIVSARAARDSERADSGQWRIVRVEEIRTPCE